MKKIDLKKNLEERVQYTEWTAKNTWNVLDRISSAKKAPITITDKRPVRSVSGFPETVTDRIRKASPIHAPTWPIAWMPFPAYVFTS